MVQRDHLLPIPAAILLQLGEAASGLSGTRPVSGQHSNPARAGSCWALQDYVVALERVQACCAAPDHSQSVGVGSLWSQPWFVPGQLQNLTSARPPPCQAGGLGPDGLSGQGLGTPIQQASSGAQALQLQLQTSSLSARGRTIQYTEN